VGGTIAVTSGEGSGVRVEAVIPVGRKDEHEPD
jgi:hypothetical protein